MDKLRLAYEEPTQFLLVSQDALTVHYVGKNQHDTDFGVIRTNLPLPSNSLAYFEVKLTCEREFYCVLGLTDWDHLIQSIPTSSSICSISSDGIVSHQGKRYQGTSSESAMRSLKSGDVIGIGIVHETKEIFTTLNGVETSYFKYQTPCHFRPTIALHTPQLSACFNFGSSPFRYNLETRISEFEKKVIQNIDSKSFPSMDRIVYNYLIFHAYEESAAAFMSTSSSTILPLTLKDEFLLESLPLRSELRRFLNDYNYESAYQLIETHYPQVLHMDSDILYYFKFFQILHFIHQTKFENALELVQENASIIWRTSKRELTQQLMSFFCYADPTKECPSTVAHFFHPSFQDRLFEMLNATIIKYLIEVKQKNATDLLLGTDSTSSRRKSLTSDDNVMEETQQQILLGVPQSEVEKSNEFLGQEYTRWLKSDLNQLTIHLNTLLKSIEDLLKVDHLWSATAFSKYSHL